MTYFCENISDLLTILKYEGDKVLDASSKLSLSSSLLFKLNSTLTNFYKAKTKRGCSAQLDSSSGYSTASSRSALDVGFLYDIVQRTIALKIVPDSLPVVEPCLIDLQFFENLKFLEVNRISLNLVKGLKHLRSHLEYINCIRSVGSLNDALKYCGADKTQGFIWNQLKNAVFSHNYLSVLDSSLEFTPKLEVLDLSHNNIRDARNICCLSKLSNLNLSFNKLEILPIFNSSICDTLHSLSLHSNFIEDIKGLSILVNLQELDLSYNFLLYHSSLAPLSCLPKLTWLNLKGNPLSFHPTHRIFTLHYLHPLIIPTKFILDYSSLSSTEQKLLCTLDIVEPSRTRTESSSSAAVSDSTEDTVIENLQNSKMVEDLATVSSECPSSLSFTSASSEEASTVIELPFCNTSEKTTATYIEDMAMNMQDSGCFAGTRPMSRSQSSIGSASSLNKEPENHDSESEVEVLTNPSEGSIEVLDNHSHDSSRYSSS